MEPKHRHVIRDYTIASVIAIAAALFIRTYFVEAYRIPSASMHPTLEAGDTLFALKTDRDRTPSPGEVVVFAHPEEQGRDYIKRVLAVGGQNVAVRKGELWIDGVNKVVTRDAQGGSCGQEEAGGRRYAVCWEAPLPDDFGPEQVPAGQIFVLGDLRSRQADARRQLGWGMIPISVVKGRARWIWLSIEPSRSAESSGWFSRIRFERMFREIR